MSRCDRGGGEKWPEMRPLGRRVPSDLLEVRFALVNGKPLYRDEQHCRSARVPSRASRGRPLTDRHPGDAAVRGFA